MGMKPRTLCCIGCCVVSVVVIAVMVPVTIFLIAPAIAQHTLNEGVLTISNSTLLPCPPMFGPGLHYSEVINHATLTNSAPLGVTVHKYNTTLSTFVCNGSAGVQGSFACDNATEVTLGSYMAPEMHLSHGTNTIEQDVSMSLVDVNLLLSGFILPLMGTPHHQVLLVVKSDDVSVSTLGLKINKLSLRKELTCSFVEQTQVLPAQKYCGGATVSGVGLGAVLKCEYGVHTTAAPTTSTTAAATTTGVTTTTKHAEIAI